MLVTGLHIYPLKSGRGVAVEEAAIEPRGFVGDRRWMVVNEDGKLLSQRDLPAFARIDAALTGGGIALSSEGHAPIEIETPTASAPRRSVHIWGDDVVGACAGARADAWLSEALEHPATLVHFPVDGVRPVDQAYGAPGDEVTFADSFPVLLTTESSLDDLNARASQAVPMDRFRPNLVIGGSAAFAEDDWQRLRIGEITFRVVKPCDRCITTVTDQTTGERGLEPLRTLAMFRRTDAGVLFGENAIPDGSGVIRVGDPVEVLE